MKRFLHHLSAGANRFFTTAVILCGLAAGGLLIYNGLQFDGAMQGLLIGGGALLILYCLSLLTA